MIKSGYIIVFYDGRYDNRVWKSREKLKKHIQAIIKNNSLEQRKMTGYIGLRIKKVNLYPRQRIELSNTKEDYIFT